MRSKNCVRVRQKISVTNKASNELFDIMFLAGMPGGFDFTIRWLMLLLHVRKGSRSCMSDKASSDMRTELLAKSVMIYNMVLRSLQWFI